MNRNRWATLLPLLLLCPSLALAAEPRVTITAPAVAKVANLVVLDASQSEGDDFVWESTTGESFAVDSNGKRAYFVAAVPGKYRFLLVAAGVVDGKARLAKGIAEVIVDGIVPPTPVPPGPSPDPSPTPGPPAPTPTPPTPLVEGHLYITYIADASNITPAQAAFKRAPLIVSAANQYDASYRWYQSDEAELKTLNLIAHAPALPAVIVQSKDGRVVEAKSAPTDSDVVAIVKKLRGVK